MLIVKKVTKTENGYDANWVLSEEQMNYLITFAINKLLAEGIVSIEEQSDDEDEQVQLDLLDSLDEKQMEKQ